MKHTKGPWGWSGLCRCDDSYHVGTIGKRGVTGIGIDAEHSMEIVIADVWVDDMDDPLVVSEAEANAELIAKAPAMYDQLASARAIMQKFVDKVDRGMARSIETYAEMKQWMEDEHVIRK